MYLPNAFRVDDLAELHGFIRRHPFAALVSGAPPEATHLPMLLDGSRGPLGTLQGHLARSNPQWEVLESAGEVLLIFHGPHAYVSPTWYEVELAVPTWNYAVVHAYGRARLIEEEAPLRQIVEELTRTFEASRPEPWSTDRLPEEWLQKLLRGIVGFEVEITRLQGKYKLGQNRSLEDQRRVAAALCTSAFAAERDLADFQRRWLEQNDDHSTRAG